MGWGCMGRKIRYPLQHNILQVRAVFYLLQRIVTPKSLGQTEAEYM